MGLLSVRDCLMFHRFMSLLSISISRKTAIEREREMGSDSNSSGPLLELKPSLAKQPALDPQPKLSFADVVLARASSGNDALSFSTCS